MGKTGHSLSASDLEEGLLRWTSSIPARRGALVDADAARYVALFNATFARKITRDYYFWRYGSAANHAVPFAVDSDDKFAGVYGFQLFSLAGAATAAAALPADVIVEESFRGNGLIFWRLKREIEAETARLGGILVAVFPNPAGLAAFRSDPQYAEITRKTTFLCETTSRPAPSASHLLEFEKINRFGVESAEILASFAQNHPALAFVHRSETYLNWRFAENPVYAYDKFLVRLHGQPFAWLVLKTFTDPVSGASFGDIVDLIWRADSPAPLAETLWFALDWFDRHGIPRAAMWLQTNTLLDRVALEIGFAASPQTRPVVIKVLDERFAWLRDPGRWFLMMSDSEVY